MRAGSGAQGVWGGAGPDSRTAYKMPFTCFLGKSPSPAPGPSSKSPQVQ